MPIHNPQSQRASDLPSEYRPAGRSWLHLARALGVAVWAIGTTGFVTYLMALHAVPLPAATAATPVVAGEGNTHAASPAAKSHRWRAVHVLAAGCPCSASIADYLIRRGPANGVEELACVASEEPDGAEARALSTKLEARGYTVQRVTLEALQRDLGVRGGPWLVCIDPQGQTRYSGGYAAQRPRAGVAFEDLSILHNLQAGRTVAAEPAFGCALDPALQRQMDPLGVKYSPTASPDLRSPL